MGWSFLIKNLELLKSSKFLALSPILYSSAQLKTQLATSVFCLTGFLCISFGFLDFSGFDHFAFHDISFAEPIIFPDQFLNFAVLGFGNFLFANCLEVVDNLVSFQVRYFFLDHFSHHF